MQDRDFLRRNLGLGFIEQVLQCFGQAGPGLTIFAVTNINDLAQAFARRADQIQLYRQQLVAAQHNAADGGHLCR